MALLQHYCCEFCTRSNSPDRISKKFFPSTLHMRASSKVSMLFFWNSRYTFERSMLSLRANHETLRSCAASSSLIN